MRLDMAPLRLQVVAPNVSLARAQLLKIKMRNGGELLCQSSWIRYNVKITVEKDATLTSSLTIMDTTYSNVTVNIEGGTFNGHLRLPDNSQIAGEPLPLLSLRQCDLVNNLENPAGPSEGRLYLTV